MFLQYAAPGAMLPLFSRHLQELQFAPLEIGWVCATQALAGLVAPLLAGQLADRWWPAERCLAVCAFISSGLLWLLSGLTEPEQVFWTSLAFWSAMAPALTLGTSLSFAHLETPGQDFGRVRLWGTVGWVVAGWLLSGWFSNPDWASSLLGLARAVGDADRPEADMFRLASVLAFVFGAYSLTLPHTPPQRWSSARLAPLAALGLLRQRSFAVYCAVCLGWCMTIPFTSQVTPLLLGDRGIPLSWLPRTLTIGQASEIASLALLPMILLRLGLRGTMLLGLIAWMSALLVLMQGEPLWLVVLSLTCNGMCISCFLVAGQVFVNSRARGDIRVSAQGLLGVISSLGMLAGNLLVGWVRREFDGAFPPTFAVGAVLALILVLAFGAGFREEA